ncbi:MAG: hypothetical protein ABI375_00385 [Rudaea sp.]
MSESTIEYRDVEDHLTAAVLTRISYLTPDLASRLIESSIAAKWPVGCTWRSFGANAEDVWVDFWPRFPDPTKSQHIVEPDAILYVGEQVYVVESKRNDETGQYADQGARDWLSFYNDNSDGTPEIDEIGAYTLLLLGGIPDTARFLALAEEISHQIRHPIKNAPPTSHEHDEDGSMMPRIAWIPWTKLASTVRAIIPTATSQEARILEDINLALTYHGFGAWLTFAQLAHLASTQELHHVDLSLSTTWPSALKPSTIVQEIREPTLPSALEDWLSRFSTVSILASPSQFTLYSVQV